MMKNYQQAAEAKRRSLWQLPDLLEQAEQTLTENGFTVFWAETAEEARQHVLNIARKYGSQSIAKSKSMATEEITLNDALIANGLDVIETDLGEYILQLNDFRNIGNHVVITGASRTADIGMELVLGAHGPAELHIIVFS